MAKTKYQTKKRAPTTKTMKAAVIIEEDEDDDDVDNTLVPVGQCGKCGREGELGNKCYSCRMFEFTKNKFEAIPLNSETPSKVSAEEKKLVWSVVAACR
jgi:hypothetical protein